MPSIRPDQCVPLVCRKIERILDLVRLNRTIARMSKTLYINREQPEPGLIEDALRVLNSGGLVVVPTETVYGLACNPEIPGAMEKLRNAKGRPDHKPIARLTASAEQVKRLVLEWEAGMQALADLYWPGPLTMVLETASEWVGFRLPDHPVALALAEACGTPLALTSANRSGEADTRIAQAARDSVECDLVLDSGPSGDQAIPSTVIKIGNGTIECLREGALPFSAIEQVYFSPSP